MKFIYSLIQYDPLVGSVNVFEAYSELEDAEKAIELYRKTLPPDSGIELKFCTSLLDRDIDNYSVKTEWIGIINFDTMSFEASSKTRQVVVPNDVDSFHANYGAAYVVKSYVSLEHLKQIAAKILDEEQQILDDIK